MSQPSALVTDDDRPAVVGCLVSFLLLFIILCLEETTPSPKPRWERATLQEAHSGKFEIKTGFGARGGMEYYKKVRQ